VAAAHAVDLKAQGVRSNAPTRLLLSSLQGIPLGGHFLDRDGFERLDKAWDILQAMLKHG